jgi:hypothetical protein
MDLALSPGERGEQVEVGRGAGKPVAMASSPCHDTVRDGENRGRGCRWGRKEEGGAGPGVGQRPRGDLGKLLFFIIFAFSFLFIPIFTVSIFV